MRTIAALLVAAVFTAEAFVVTPAPRVHTAVAVSRSTAPEMVVFVSPSRPNRVLRNSLL
jgi:hypothetical protein